MGLDLAAGEQHIHGDGEGDEQGEDEPDSDQGREPGGAAAVAGLLAEVAGDVPAPVVERGDEVAGGEPGHAVEVAESEPPPVEGGHAVALADADQGARPESDEDHQLDSGDDELGPCGEAGAAEHHPQHEQEPGGSGGGGQGGVLGERRVEQAERHLPGGQRSGHHEDGRGDDERPAAEESEKGVQGAADPGVGGPRVDVDPAEPPEGEHDAEHGYRAVQQRGGTGEPHGADEHGGGGGQRVGGRAARDRHDNGVERGQDVGLKPSAAGGAAHGPNIL